MTQIKKLLIPLSFFVAGIIVNRAVNRSASSAPDENHLSCPKNGVQKKSDAIAISKAGSPPKIAISPNALSKISTAPGAAHLKNEAEPSEWSSKLKSGIIDDDELASLSRENFSEGNQPLMAPGSQNGKLATRETLSNGGVLDRAYDADGHLTGESLKLASGEELHRSFYGDGSVRGAALIKPNGELTSATFLQTGYPKARVDKMADGTEISTEYDDRGVVLDRWKRSKDGQTERL